MQQRFRINFKEVVTFTKLMSSVTLSDTLKYNINLTLHDKSGMPIKCSCNWSENFNWP